MKRTSGVIALTALVLAACTSQGVAPPQSSPSFDAASPADSPAEPPIGEIEFVLRDRYPAGHRVPVRIRNTGDVAYEYQTMYQACDLVYRDSAGRAFLIPPGTHCDLISIAAIAPGETKLLFKWGLDECTRDAWGCVRSRPLEPGTYSIAGVFKAVESRTPARAEAMFTVTAAQAATDYSTFISALRSGGHDVRSGERTGFPVRRFAIPGQVVYVDGVPVSAFEFGTAQRLAAFRSGVSPEGDEIPIRHGGMIIISWDPPRFYASGKLLVLYFGDGTATAATLNDVLGPPFAGF